MTSAASDLARRLARDAEALCRRYLSNGRREGRYWTVGNVANERGRSLYVRLVGRESGPGAAGKWTDAATGEHGDLLDLIRLNLGLTSLRATLDEARRFVGDPRPEPVLSPISDRPDAARRLFAMARSVTGTPAEAYLRGRGLVLPPDHRALRYHPACYYRARPDAPRESRPALLAAVTDDGGTVQGVHRTWLDDRRPIKARLPTPRRAMGHLLGHAVRFGTTGDVLVAGEGIETMLSVTTALATMPVVAALSAAHLSAFHVQPGLRRLYVVRERDAAGSRAFDALYSRLEPTGVTISPIDPVFSDLNDDLRRLGITAFREHLVAQLIPDDRARIVVSDET